MLSFAPEARRVAAARLASSFLLAFFVVVAHGCTNNAPTGVDATSGSLTVAEPPLVDTRPWLTEVPNPPMAWRRVVANRKGVLRHRFIRFKRPSALPPARARFLLEPFADTRIVLRLRRAGPVEGVGYSWFGMFEHDPHGFGGLVVRPNGWVSVDIQTPDHRRFQVANLGNGGYAILEVEAERELECAFEGGKA